MKNPEQLVPWENNPERRSRLSSRGVQKLVESIKEEGCVNVPLLLWRDGKTVMDGHRRRVASIAAGLKAVPCVVYRGRKKTIQEAWAEVNRTHKAQSSQDWLAVYVKTGSFDGIPSTIVGHIKTCIEFLKKDGLQWILDHDAAPTVGRTSRGLITSLEMVGHRLPKAKVLMWIVETRSQNDVNHFLSRGPAPRKKLTAIAEAIKAGRKFKF